MGEEQKDLKRKNKALKNEKDEIIKQHQNKTDLTNKEYNELKLRYDGILEGSQNDETTMIELKNNMDSLRTKNDEYMLQIKTLDAEKTNLSENIIKITKERNETYKKYKALEANYNELQNELNVTI